MYNCIELSVEYRIIIWREVIIITLLILYLLVNIVLSILFEKRKWSVVIVLHSVEFTVLLIFLLFSCDNIFTSQAMVNIVGQNAVDILKNAIQSAPSEFVIAPLLIIEGIVIVTSMLIISAAAYKIVMKIVSGNAYDRKIKSAAGLPCTRRRCTCRLDSQKLYRMNCVMLC